MNIYQFLSFAGPAIGILSFAYAIYTRKKSKLEKNLVYEVMPPVAVAEVIKGQSAYSLKVVYERPGEDSVYIRHAFVEYIRFTNFGRIPIKKNDLAKADPLRIEATTGGRVLDISLASVTSDVCQITIGQPKQENGRTSAILDFDFLDYLDGGLIQILSDTDEVQATLHGTVIGMPNGIRKEKDISGPRSPPTWGCVTAIVVELVALAAVPLIYRFVTGSWKLVWLLGLPVAALIVPPLFFLLVFLILEPGAKFKFPEPLLPPDWYGLRRELSYRLPETRYKTQKTGPPSYKAEAIKPEGPERVPKRISLQAWKGQYVSAENVDELAANQDEISEKEIFELIEREGEKVALRAWNNKYVCAESDGRVVANRDAISRWETFELIERGGEKIALRAWNDKYVCAEGGGGREVVANRDEIHEWETFTLIRHD